MVQANAPLTSPPRATRGRLRRLAALAVLALLLLARPPLLAADETEKEDVPAGTTKLSFEGTAALKEIGSLGEEDFRFTLEVGNATEEAIEILAANLLLVHEGGWLAPLDPDPMDGSFFRGTWEVSAGKTRPVGSWSYRSLSPAIYTLLSVQAGDGHAEVVVPILREGFETPSDYAAPYPLGVGVIGPLEVVPFSDGKRSVLVIGQHQVLRAETPTDVKTKVFIGDDAGSTEPVAWEGLEAQGDLVALWPFVRRLNVYEQFESGHLRIETSGIIDDVRHTFVHSWPVTSVEPTKLLGPVLGAWQLGNGPGQSSLQPHYLEPQHRYAYDFVVMERGRTHKGDPHRNQSYFAWNRSILAAADGVVVDVCDREPDNPGYRGSISDCFNNRIVIEHDDGLFTAYLHIRQRSAGQRVLQGNRVKAGQVIASVGNSGNSAEPHLHFMAFRVDATGRMRSVPVAFENAHHDAAGEKPVAGVPVGGSIYYFK